MLSRRECLQTGAAATLVATAGAPAGAAVVAAPTVRTPVDFRVPRGACDTHVHLYDPARFPYVSTPAGRPPPATAGQLGALQKALHLDRVVIVTPTAYVTDNAATLDAIAQLGVGRARGVAMIDETTSRGELQRLHAGGVRGVRLVLVAAKDPAAVSRRLDTLQVQLDGLGIHPELFARPALLAALKNRLNAYPGPIAIDHLAGIDAGQGVDQPGFREVLDLVASGKAYVNLSGAYWASKKAPDYPDVQPFFRALLAANPDRLLWGSDWPHPGIIPVRAPDDIKVPQDIDDGRVLNLLGDWFVDAATRRKILVDNPARLYGF